MASATRILAVKVDSGDAFEVKGFSVRERISTLFEITLLALSENHNVDFDAVLGRPARFRLDGGYANAEPRVWTGICNHIQQVEAEGAGRSTYELAIVPPLWLATQRRNHRMFQQISELDIAQKLLGEWGIEPVLRIKGLYKKRKYRVQYGESDYAFLCRMLEDAGISFYFEQGDVETHMVLSDAPQGNDPRPAPLPFLGHLAAVDKEYVTAVRIGQRVRPGRYTMRDHDSRLQPSYKLLASAADKSSGVGVESRLEQFHYTPGAFQFGTDQGDDMPFADDKGKCRSDEKEGAALATKRLEAKRTSAKVCSFETTALDLAPGVVMSILDHPRADIADGKPLLVVESTFTGSAAEPWTHRCEAHRADIPFRPPVSTPKPKVTGVESATVVGPAGEEIHTDEMGRIRVHFHWDRESTMNENSSCWIHVSQPWGGAGYGGSNLPRIGQEVLVDFLGGDPDKPVIVGRLYTNLQKTPYTLPTNKTQSGWKSNSSPQSGGYNEIMFEDAAGKELVRMQAEKDLHKLVKNDEKVTIGHDRTKLVQNDDRLTVENDRRKFVQRDESVTIGHNRTKLVQNDDVLTVANDRAKAVQHDENVVIGHDRTKLVENDDALTVGNSRTKTIKNDEDVTIGHDRSRLVQNDDDLTVGNNRTKIVQMNEREVVGVSRTRVVGLNEDVEIGLRQSVNVGDAQNIAIGTDQSTTVRASQDVTVGASQNITVGVGQNINVGGARTLSVGLASTETVGLIKTLVTGAEYVVSVASSMDTTVKTNQTESIGLIKTVVVGSKLELICGKSKLVLENSGKITLEGTDILLKSSGPMASFAGTTMCLLSPNDDLVIKGNMVKINTED